MTAPAPLDADAIAWAWPDTPVDRGAAVPSPLPIRQGAISISTALAGWRSGLVREKHVPRLMTGFPRIDRATRGLQSGECFQIIGRTASGKTMLSGNIFDNMVTQRPASAFLIVNLEMPSPQLIGRMLRQRFARTEDAIERDALADQLDVENFVQRNQNLYFLDRGAVSLDDIRQEAEDLIQRIAPTPLDGILIDHAGLLRSHRAGSAYERATHAAIGAKQLARELNTIVMLIVQANRGGKQEDNEPVPLESARDSGAFEENADFVLALGSIVNVPHAGRPHVKARLAKNRRGPVVPLTISFDPLSLRMGEMDEAHG